MAVPQIMAVAPAGVTSLGGEAVRVVVRDAGARVAVWLGAVRAAVTAREETVEGTVVWIAVPPQEPGSVLVQVENLDAAGQPVPGERSPSSVLAVTRPSLVREGLVARLTRALLRALRSQVVASVRMAVAVDFDDEPADDLRATVLAASPGLTLGAPTFEPNRFYAPAAPPRVVRDTPAGPRLVEAFAGVTVDLVYELVGTSQHAVELLNLMAATATWLQHTRWIALRRDPDDASSERVRWELDSEGGMRSSIGAAEGVHTFSTQLRIRGVTLEAGAMTGLVVAASGGSRVAMQVDRGEVHDG